VDTIRLKKSLQANIQKLSFKTFFADIIAVNSTTFFSLATND
jgi:hypothetical protein